MLQHSELDRVFHALSDVTRRALVARLGQGAASVSELASPFDVSLSAIGQHIQVLEASGLVRTQKAGRVRTVELLPEALSAAEQWLASHRKLWEHRFDRLGLLLEADEASPKPKRKQSKRS
jgi:DNA-binding transcriptional ArsR family regulator